MKLELDDRDDSVVSTLTTIGVIADLGFGNDRFDGSAGAGASVYGGFGRDVVIGGRSGDYLAGGNDNDRVTGNAGDDLIELGEGHDWSDGGWGRDTIFGGIGSDTIYGGAGNDHLQGSGEGIVDDFEADDDRIFGQIGSDELWGEKGNDYLHAGVGTDQYVDGGEHRDVCLGLDVDKTACES